MQKMPSKFPLHCFCTRLVPKQEHHQPWLCLPGHSFAMALRALTSQQHHNRLSCSASSCLAIVHYAVAQMLATVGALLIAATEQSLEGASRLHMTMLAHQHATVGTITVCDVRPPFRLPFSLCP
jgi:hypothetical protein